MAPKPGNAILIDPENPSICTFNIAAYLQNSGAQNRHPGFDKLLSVTVD